MFLSARLAISNGTCLFLVAALGVCVTASARQFTDVSVAAGLHRDPTRAWGNPLWGDLNGDGRLDLFVPNHETPKGVQEGGILPYIYINNGDGTFTDVIASSGIMDVDPDTGAWQGISIADYDGDGNLDIYIAEPPFGGGNTPEYDLLWKGNGDATWTYVSPGVGILLAKDYGECSFFFDYDNDGSLDLFVKNIPIRVGATAANVLYRNNGNGTFTPINGAAGLADATHGVTEGSIVSFADYDNDGLMDAAFSGNGTAEALYHHNSDGTFVDVTTAAGIVPGTNSQGIAWGDYNNDGLLDLYISHGDAKGIGNLHNNLYRNNGDGTFTDVSAESGTDDNTDTWAAAWDDYDNDGFLDLFVARPGTNQIGLGNANLLYHNNGDGTFTDVAAQEGVALQDDQVTSAHKLAAWGDYNDDGFLDLCVKDGIGPHLVTGDAYKGLHYLLKNNGNSNHYLKVNLQGVTSNLNGIGARVTVTYGGKTAFRENNGGGGGEWGSQGAGPLHFGIGSATSAAVEVQWPSGATDTLATVAANTTITITENTTAAPVITQQPRSARVMVGQRAKFRVEATGAPRLTYQWRKNGTDIPGATGSTYTTPPAVPEDSGSRFLVVVSNSLGSVTSKSAKLTVISTAKAGPSSR